MECAEKAPPLQKTQGWATRLQSQRLKRTSKAKCNFKGKAQLQKQRASGRLLGGALALLGDFGKLAGFYVVDEAAHGNALNVGVVLDAGDLAADILLNVLEGVEVSWRDGGDAGLVFEFI